MLVELVRGLDVDTQHMITRAFEYQGGTRVLRVPLFDITKHAGPKERTHLHPIERVRKSYDDETLGVYGVDPLLTALVRVEYCAAFLCWGWNPAMYEAAVELAGKLVTDEKTPQQLADRRAIAVIKQSAHVPVRCEHCRHFKAMSRVNSASGACRRHDRLVKAQDVVPECYQQCFSQDEYLAAAAFEAAQPIP